MKKIYLLILMCSIANINIFAAENTKEIPRTFSQEEIDILILKHQQRISDLNTEMNKSKDQMRQLKDDELNRLNQLDNDLRIKHKINDKK